MSNIINQSLKTSVVNYIGILLGAIFTLYISPKFLPTEYNGLYRLLMEYAAVAGAYFHFGMPIIINKYFHKIFDNTSRSVKGFDFIVIIVPIIAISLLSVVLIIFRKNITLFLSGTNDFGLIYKYILYIIPLIITNSYSALIESYTAMLGNIIKVNFYRNVLVRIFNITSVIVYALTLNFSLTMLIIATGAMLSAILSFVNLGNLKGWNFNFRPSCEFLTTRGLGREFLKYTLYLIVANLSLFLVTKIDIFFVAKLSDLSNVAYYTTAMFLIIFIAVPYQAVLNISFPHISKAFIDNDTERIELLLKNNALFGFTTSFFIVIAIWINIDSIYTIMPKGELYSAGKYVFFILAIGKLADTSIGSLGHLLTVSKWYTYTLYSLIGISIISISLGYSLTLKWGIYGTAIAVTTCNFLNVGYQLFIVKYKLKISPYNWNFIYVLLVGIVVTFVSYGIDMFVSNVWISIVLKTIIIATLFFGAIYKFKLSDEIVSIMISVKNKIKLG